MRITRRGLLIAAGLAGGGLAVGAVGLGTWADTFDPGRLQRATLTGDARMLTAWITIDPGGTVTLLGPHTEMGQGSQTGLLQIVLDELDADPETTRFQLAPAESAFVTSDAIAGLMLEHRELEGWARRFAQRAIGRGDVLLGIQLTGGSSAIRFTGWGGIRRAAALARQMLAEAGAAHLGVDPAQVETRRGRVVHAATGASVGYGEVVDRAASLPIPAEPTYKDPARYAYIGTSYPRFDLPEKVFGEPVYGIDVAVPGMRFAAVAPPPLARGTITGVRNEAAVKALRGVEAVLVFDAAVAVVADNPWRAEQAVRRLDIECTPPAGGPLDGAALAAHRLEAARGASSRVLRVGRGAENLAGSDLVEATYTTPYLAHVPMEPMNATLWEEDGVVHLATGTQGPLKTRRVAARSLGRPVSQVVLHAKTMGGGFGRRNSLVPEALDWVVLACRIWKTVGGAVKMTWSREAGLRMGCYHPADVGLLQARLGSDGKPVAWRTRVFHRGSSLAKPIYAIPAVAVDTADGKPALPFAYWRSVAAFCNLFFIECFVDELAHAAGKDPVAYRLSLLDPEGRPARVLRRAAEMAGWSTRRAGDRGYGVAVGECFGSVVAEVAEVSMQGSTPRVHRVWCALDCGLPINPGSVEAQAQGGIFFGLSAALHGRIDLRDGRIPQGNFDAYRVVTFQEAPRIEVDVMRSPGAPVGGVGEVSTPLVAPAVCNAVAALTERPRSLPLIA